MLMPELTDDECAAMPLDASQPGKWVHCLEYAQKEGKHLIL
jgi:hypothetical protein